MSVWTDFSYVSRTKEKYENAVRNAIVVIFSHAKDKNVGSIRQLAIGINDRCGGATYKKEVRFFCTMVGFCIACDGVVKVIFKIPWGGVTYRASVTFLLQWGSILAWHTL